MTEEEWERVERQKIEMIEMMQWMRDNAKMLTIIEQEMQEDQEYEETKQPVYFNETGVRGYFTSKDRDEKRDCIDLFFSFLSSEGYFEKAEKITVWFSIPPKENEDEFASRGFVIDFEGCSTNEKIELTSSTLIEGCKKGTYMVDRIRKIKLCYREEDE